MDEHTYNEIYSQLEGSTIKSISLDFGVNGDVLTCILNQKLVRTNKALYHKVSNRAEDLLERWISGESIVSLSDEIGFSPVLMSLILLKRHGISRRKVRQMLKNLEEVEDARLKNELSEVLKNDNLFTQHAHSLQVKRARMCEEEIGKWLKDRGIQFLDEEEIKKHTSTKTPDFLLKGSLKINSTKVTWIESKGLFGDAEEHRRFLDKQFLEYVKIYGAGVVVYWYGYVDSIVEENSEILIMDSTNFGVDDVKYLW